MEIIETQVCGRCGGTGQHSYCQMYGRTCFGCGGQGKAYTKRGRAVAAYWRELTTIPTETIEAGMRIKFEFGINETITATVKEVTKTETTTDIVTAGGKTARFVNVRTGQVRYSGSLDGARQAQGNLNR